MKVLITGAAGFLGSELLSNLAKDRPNWELCATDVRLVSIHSKWSGIKCEVLDVSNEEAVKQCIKSFKPDAIVHLASIVSPPPGMTEEKMRAIDVDGTRHILEAAIESRVKQIIVTSSGAAYGYYKDNPEWLKETDVLRGHSAFAYARHKLEIENMLAEYREKFPKLKQLILRPGTILGATVNNQITDLFKKRSILGISGSASPFVFIWDEDVIAIIRKGLENEDSGIFNVAGDGALSLSEIAKILKKPYRSYPAWLLIAILFILKKLGMTQYGPEQIDFLRYRPVLLNEKLKKEFGYIPKFTSREAFFEFLKATGVKPHVE